MTTYSSLPAAAPGFIGVGKQWHSTVYCGSALQAWRSSSTEGLVSVSTVCSAFMAQSIEGLKKLRYIPQCDYVLMLMLLLMLMLMLMLMNTLQALEHCRPSALGVGAPSMTNSYWGTIMKSTFKEILPHQIDFKNCRKWGRFVKCIFRVSPDLSWHAACLKVIYHLTINKGNNSPGSFSIWGHSPRYRKISTQIAPFLG